MNPNDICSHLTSVGLNARLQPDQKMLETEFTVDNQALFLVHRFPLELLGLPKFQLVGANRLPKLAHVIVNPTTGLGAVCVADGDSLSVNLDVPELAYQASLDRHIGLLKRALRDPEWNRQELLREFTTNWEVFSRQFSQRDDIYAAWYQDNVQSLQVRAPTRNSGISLASKHLALSDDLANDARWETLRRTASWSSRTSIGKGILLHLSSLQPAPSTPEELLPWYAEALHFLEESSRHTVDRLRKQPATKYWLVFSAPIPGGVSSFALHFRSPIKRPLPLSEEDAREWTLIPYNVRSLSRDALVTRGGGATELLHKSVLLVGCGSVGSEVAHRLTSAGVGRLTISDPDRFSEVNLYRHTLDIYNLDNPKSLALPLDLHRKHPWAAVVGWTKRLEELRDQAILAQFDLIIVAIGSPTLERVFANYCRQQKIQIAAINCWVEAYGIGGHAILGVPGTRGCWHCAYVDPETLGRGLASNLNFLAPNQDLNRTHGGCGIQFLPYSGTAASFTATMTVDLAVRFLKGNIRVSSSVSWKGPSIEAEERGFHLTHRYRHFADSLEVRPLYNPDCDLCAG